MLSITLSPKSQFSHMSQHLNRRSLATASAAARTIRTPRRTGWTPVDAGQKSASGKSATADCERLARLASQNGPKRRNCGFLGLESAYSSNEP